MSETLPGIPFGAPEFFGPLPQVVDVAVIGGGIIGVMTAWHLAARGLRVLICEKGRIAAEQSSRNWGWVRQQGRDPAELPIMIESMAIWRQLSQELGEGLGFRQTGVTFLARNDREMAEHAAWLTVAAAHGLDTRQLSASELSALMPGQAGGWKGALHTPSDARAEPWVAVPMIARALAARGVSIREHCAVRGLERTAGKVSGVITEAGPVACAHVVLAGGAWSRLFLRRLGIRLPQLLMRASVAATEALPEVCAGAAADAGFAFRRRADGGYTLAPMDHHDFHIGRDAFESLGFYISVLPSTLRVTRLHGPQPKGYPDALGTRRRWKDDSESPFERMRVLDPPPDRRVLDRVAGQFQAAFPQLGPVRLKAAWGGMIDALPDVVPVIDHAPIPGLSVATGMSGHGFGIGPGVGRVMAALVMGEAPGHDLSRFRLSRFVDGTKMVPGPGL